MTIFSFKTFNRKGGNLNLINKKHKTKTILYLVVILSFKTFSKKGHYLNLINKQHKTKPILY